MSKAHRLRSWLPSPLLRAAKWVRESGRVGSAFAYDFNRYLRHSSSIDWASDKKRMRAVLTERYHSIEKGLSLPAPRPGFGSRPLADIVSLLPRYVRVYGRDQFALTVLAVLAAYIDFNETSGLTDSDIPFARSIRELLIESNGNVGAPVEGGVRYVTRSDIDRATSDVGQAFFQTRYSVRQFSPDPLSREEIEFAALAASKAPAVCNRQFGKLHVFVEPDEIARVLHIQGGARGFGQEIRALVVVTTTATSYWNSGQRNQGWVDGGLFAMSFMMGLHAQGIGSIALNWSKGPRADRVLREAIQLDPDESVIMLIGCGKLRDEFTVANSQRTPVAEVLAWHGAL